jgi:hypothetical protein
MEGGEARIISLAEDHMEQEGLEEEDDALLSLLLQYVLANLFVSLSLTHMTN